MSLVELVNGFNAKLVDSCFGGFTMDDFNDDLINEIKGILTNYEDIKKKIIDVGNDVKEIDDESVISECLDCPECVGNNKMNNELIEINYKGLYLKIKCVKDVSISID